MPDAPAKNIDPVVSARRIPVRATTGEDGPVSRTRWMVLKLPVCNRSSKMTSGRIRSIVRKSMSSSALIV